MTPTTPTVHIDLLAGIGGFRHVHDRRQRQHVFSIGDSVIVTLPRHQWIKGFCERGATFDPAGPYVVGTEGGEHTVRPARFILLEDAWALCTESLPLIDLSLFVRVPPDIALARRLERDLLQGEPPLPIVHQYLKIGRR